MPIYIALLKVFSENLDRNLEISYPENISNVLKADFSNEGITVFSLEKDNGKLYWLNHRGKLVWTKTVERGALHVRIINEKIGLGYLKPNQGIGIAVYNISDGKKMSDYQVKERGAIALQVMDTNKILMISNVNDTCMLDEVAFLNGTPSKINIFKFNYEAMLCHNFEYTPNGLSGVMNGYGSSLNEPSAFSFILFCMGETLDIAGSIKELFDLEEDDVLYSSGVLFFEHMTIEKGEPKYALYKAKTHANNKKVSFSKAASYSANYAAVASNNGKALLLCNDASRKLRIMSIQ